MTSTKKSDADLFSQCFYPDSPGDWRKYCEKSLSTKELDDFATLVRGAEAADVKEMRNRPVVMGIFKERNEKISMNELSSDWKILDV